MGEQLLNNSILDQFVNSHEQSYEEFLNTFTYLLQEDRGKTAQGSNLDSLRKPFSTISDLPNRNQQDGSSGGSKEMWVSLSPQTPSEDKINESCKAGGCGGNDLSLSEGVEVDKSLDLEDVETEETCTAPHEQQFCACSWASFGSSKAQDKIELLHAWKFKSGSLVLPGQVEETVTYCTPFFEKPVQQKLRTLAAPEPPDSKAQELLGDDVQPFSLDEEFDYDNVALTPKFSEAELKAILEFSEEKKTGTDVKSAGAGD